MDVNVKVTIDLGEKTVALLIGGLSANMLKDEPKVEKHIKAVPKTEKKKRLRRTKEQIAVEAALSSNWDKLSNEDKLEAIKIEVTNQTRKGKGADIKLLLSYFDAGRASELSPADYDSFYESIIRYGQGESVESLSHNKESNY